MRGKEQIDQKKRIEKNEEEERRKKKFLESKLCKTNYFTEERPS